MGETENTKAVTVQVTPPHPGPFDQSQFLPLAWVLAIATLGGVAAFFRKLREGKARPFNFVELVGEIFISAFAGVLTYWICMATSLGQWETAAAVGVAGHMGSRGLFALEKWFEHKFGGPSQ